MTNSTRIVYNRCCFYWAVLDERGSELYGGVTLEDAEEWVRRNRSRVETDCHGSYGASQ